MSIDFVRGSTTKSVASEELINCLRLQSNLNGRLIIGYPIARTSDGSHSIDALWVSPDLGVIGFDLVEGAQLDDYKQRQDDIANRLEIHLRGEPRLLTGRRLGVPILVVTYASLKHKTDSDDTYPVLNSDSINDYIRKKQDDCIYDGKLHSLALSVLENVSRLGKRRRARPVGLNDSRGDKLNKLESTIATLDHQQSKAVMESVEGVQRIRGLAGSGKTIVLALKAAYLHAQNPDWRICVTFHTRSLKSFFRHLVRDFHVDQTGEEPDWKNLRIMNSWGAPGGEERDGFYCEFCRENETAYLDFRSAREKFSYDRAFEGACKSALEHASIRTTLYQAILIDEAQDLPPSFLELCYESLDRPKRLVYAYDELQNINRESLPSPEDIFGEDEDGVPKVTFATEDPTRPTADLILKKCYRNPGPILVTAHALGFGIYRQVPPDRSTGLVQMFDYPQLWEAVGYEIVMGKLEEGENVTLRRTEETSPSYLEAHSPTEELILFKTFETLDHQAHWIAESIARNVKNDELRPTDIMVINLDPKATQNTAGQIQAKLRNMQIHTHFAGVDTRPDVFQREDVESITFTGIHRAKGNEAAMVFIMNAESGLSSELNLASTRNKLFTAITRSKAWVRVTGVGQEMKNLVAEFNRLQSKDFKLQFRYPTAEDREHLRTIHRDMSVGELQRLTSANQKIEEIVQDLNMGKLTMKDLNPELVSALARYVREQSA